MIPIERPWAKLAIAVIEQSVEDYVILRELGAVRGLETESGYFLHTRRKSGGSGYDYYNDRYQVRSLIDFLAGANFDILCDRVSTTRTVWNADIIRRAIGLLPSTRRVLTSKDMNWSHSHAHTRPSRRCAVGEQNQETINEHETKHEPEENLEAA